MPTPARLVPLPLGSLRPGGWLGARLLRQVDGMAGHLDEFWPDVRDSAWIGGSGDGWERGPYWLDGVVPLAFLTGDQGVRAKVDRWVTAILDGQHDDGWLGPLSGDPDEAHHTEFGSLDVWPRVIAAKALLQYFGATDDPRVVPALMRLFRRLLEVLGDHPLHEWGRARWADLALCALELYRIEPADWLVDLLDLAERQGLPWVDLARRWPYRQRVDGAMLRGFQRAAGGVWMNDDFLATHGVNLAMGLKAIPVSDRMGCDGAGADLLDAWLAVLDDAHGQVTGILSCDEHLAGTSPSQGTETCAVVELLASLETAIEAWGPRESLVERWERVAFNALPASATSDETAHQYLQQVNQIRAAAIARPIYGTNGPEANLFGVEPNFGCCTANRHQGWPKFATRLWMRSDDDGLCAVSYAPCEIDTVVRGAAVRVAVDGDYPWSDDVTITIEAAEPVAFPVRLRIPAWAQNPRVEVDGVAQRVSAVILLEQSWQGTHRIRMSLSAEVRWERRPGDRRALTRGPVVFAAAFPEEWECVGQRYERPTWAVSSDAGWAVAPVEGRRITVTRGAAAGFEQASAPLVAETLGKAISSWGEDRSAAALPPGPMASDDLQDVPLRLVPYGCARIRIAEFPLVESPRLNERG